MFKMLLTLIALASTFAALPAQAGLFFCNDSGQEVAVAVGWKDEQFGWVSRGWFRIKPRECGAALIGVLQNARYYYYAESVESNLAWGGGDDSGYFCTTSSAFYLKSDSNECDGHEFVNLWVGDEEQFTVTLSEGQHDPTDAALACQDRIDEGIDHFSDCWIRQMATDKQRRILDCIDNTRSKASLALCASKDTLDGTTYRVATCANRYSETRRGDEFIGCLAKDTLSEQQAAAFNCAVRNKGDYSKIGACLLGSQMADEQRRVYDCVASNYKNYIDAGLCVVGDQLTPEQNRVARCVLNNKGSYTQMAVCAVGNDLTPEQQVFADCAISTGGQPYAFAGCVGTQLTLNELEKCLTDGIGGEGCFGDNNTAVKFVQNAWKDVTEGPGPSNDLLGKDGFIGRSIQNIGNDLTYGPGENNDLVGKNGFVCKTFFGGC